MKVRLYTEKEINKLNSSIFIRSVKYKREIEYDPIFKLWAIMMRLEFPDLSAREIFARGGIDVNIVHKKLPQRRIKEWFDSYRKFGIRYFLPEDEYYFTIRENKDKIYTMDDFKNQLLKFILEKLSEHKDEKNR